jgi:HPt (histidine-containing phosphotransfer) domain-containing protein
MSTTAIFSELAVFDHEILNANTMADASLQKELFDLYFAHAPTNFAMMRSALEGGPASGWKEGAHALKGAARTLGMTRLGEAAAVAEASGPSAERFKEVERSFAEAKNCVAVHLSQS